MEPAPFQQYCSVVPCKAGGWLPAGPKMFSCVVRIAGGECLLVQAPDTLIDHAPVARVEIGAGPALARALGAAAFVTMNQNQWAIDFGFSGSFRRARELNRNLVAALLSQGAIDRRRR
jgi:hypothetical protein